MKYWFLTLKLNKPAIEIHAEEYMEPIIYILEKFKSTEMVDNAFEEDSEGRLHFHALLKSKYIRWKMFTDLYKGSKLHINNIELKTHEDICRVQQYIQKQKLDPYLHEQKVAAKSIESIYSFDGSEHSQAEQLL